MTRLAAAIALPLVVMQVSVPPESRLSWPSVPAHAQAPGPIVAEHSSLACGLAVPTTVAEWRKRADAIVHVRLDSQVTYDHQILTLGTSEVTTAHEATVLDVFKTHPRAIPAGSSMRILQRGGIIERPDGWHRYRANDFDIMPAHTEWVLFVYWNSYLEEFEVIHFEDGAFEIQGDTIATAGRQQFAEKWRGRASSAFLAALREPSP